MEIPNNFTNRIAQYMNGRKGRNLREYATAYLMLAPALTLIFIFGLFPVGFALYVSIHKWRILQSDFRGLQNYTDAVGSFGYIALFVIGVGALFLVYRQLKKITEEAREKDVKPWLLAIPAAFHAAATLAFFRWFFFQLPEFLNIATKMRGLERTRELFQRLLSEAFYAETVYPSWQTFAWVFGLAVVVGVVSRVLVKLEDNGAYQSSFAIIWLALSVGIGLLIFNFNTISAIYAESVVSGEDPGIWPQLVIIATGFILLAGAWKMWQSAEDQNSTLHFAVRIFAGIILMVGAVLLIIEIPTIVASGDEDLWNGIKVTVFFSLGTVPVQLTIALFLSVLLFQGVKGSDIFRVIFFLPYVTPAVASATVFRLMFSDRAAGPANIVLGWLGIQPQGWLREADGILTMLARAVGFADYPASFVPTWLPDNLEFLIGDWLNGPSMALMVVIMLSVWTFIGYNVVIYLAGLANIPHELTEAAEIDGATKWDVFRHITFPLLSPTTYFLSLIAVMGTFKAFNTIWVMRARVGSALGTMDTFSVLIFEEFFTKTRYGYASALAFILFAIILILTVVNNRIQGSRVFYG
jgi:multiple sugar transport system permease protein